MYNDSTKERRIQENVCNGQSKQKAIKQTPKTKEERK
jgi:hypothetical protein